MRDLLTGLAIILIVALTTALVAPYLVDWNSQRGFLETQLSRVFGQRVTIGGNIDLKLLPTPYLRLNQTVIGSDDGPIRVGIRHLDLELSVAPLLHGEFDIVEGRLDEPTIRVTLRPDRTLPSLPPTPALRADLRFERITVSDATLAVADPQSGRTFVLDHIDFNGDAPSLSGPYKASGTVGEGARRTHFRVSTSEAKKGRTHLHLSVNETPAHAGLDLDGVLALASIEPGALRQTFDGKATATGHLLDLGSEPIDWRLAGRLQIDPAHAGLDGGELTLGTGDSDLTLAASGDAAFGEHPKVDLLLAAGQLDVDKLGGPPVGDKPAPPPQLPAVATLRRLLAKGAAMPLSVDLNVDNAIWGGETLSGVHAQLSGVRNGDPLQGEQLFSVAADGPGGSRLAASGTLAAPGVDAWTGKLDLDVNDLPAAETWLKSIDKEAAFAAAGVPFRSMRVKGKLSGDAERISADHLDLTLGATELSGTGRFTFGDRGEPGLLALALTTKLLDLDAVPSWTLLRGGDRAPRLALQLDADALKVASLAGHGSLAAGRLHLSLAKAGSAVSLRELHAEDLGGAAVDAKGSLELRGSRGIRNADFDVSVDAQHLQDAAALIQRIAPGSATEGLAERAESLSPARIRLSGAVKAAEGGKLVPSRLALKATLAGTDLDVHLDADSSGTGAVLTAQAQSPDEAALLHQLGARTITGSGMGGSMGGGSATLTARGDLDQPLDTQLRVRLGDTRIAVDGRFELFDTARGGSGAMSLKSRDLAPLLRSLSIASSDLAARVPAEITGAVAIGQAGFGITAIKGQLAGAKVAGTVQLQTDARDRPALTGALDVDHLALADLLALSLGPTPGSSTGNAGWTDKPFKAGLAEPPHSTVSLHAKTLTLASGLTADDAKVDLELAPNLLALKKMSAALNGGRVSGALTLRRDDALASVEGNLSLDTMALRLPNLSTTLSGTLALAGSGRSPLALVASLAGAGTATAADIAISRAEGQGLVRVFDDVERDALAVDGEMITRALDADARQPFRAGTRQFDLGLAGGTLTAKPVGAGDPEPQPVKTRLDASLDLRKIMLSVNLEETLRNLPKDWTGPPPSVTLTLAGSPDALKRSWELGRLLNALAARAIARESARIEAYETDVRERAFFNERLQTDRRREQDRIKAEADAAAADLARRAADAARKAADDQRRAEASDPGKTRQGEGGSGPGEQPPQPRFQAPSPGTSVDPSAAGRY